MKRFHLFCILIFYTTLVGCYPLQRISIPEEVGTVFQDAALIVAVAAFHTEYQRWPKDLDEFSSSVQKDFSEIEIKQILFLPQETGSLIVEINPPMANLNSSATVSTLASLKRKIEIKPPSTPDGKYIATYLNEDHSNIRMNGKMEFHLKSDKDKSVK